MRTLWPGIDPLALGQLVWPETRFYSKQREIIYSVEENLETYVPAGNKLGKDYVTGFICLNLFLRCLKEGLTCRIITTSVAEHHLKVLWGEIGRFIEQARFPLLAKDKGPLVVNYMEIRRASEMLAKNPLNYLSGRVSEKGEGLAGHHADVTLIVGDESSGLDDVVHEMGQGWAKRMLWIGNPNPTNNFFFKGVEAGDLDYDETVSPPTPLGQSPQ